MGDGNGTGELLGQETAATRERWGADDPALHAMRRLSWSVMQQYLELELDAAAKTLPDTEVATIACGVVFDGGEMHQGAVKRGPLPGTYILGGPAMRPAERPNMPPTRVDGVMVELVFEGKDIRRLVFNREVATGPMLSPQPGRVWAP